MATPSYLRARQRAWGRLAQEKHKRYMELLAEELAKEPPANPRGRPKKSLKSANNAR